MANPEQIVFLVALGFIAVVGCVLNGLSLAVLALGTQLRKHLTSVRWLMFGEALSMFIICSVGAPLLFANVFVNMGENTAASVARCEVTFFCSYVTMYVAMWFQTVIALTRVCAVFVPIWYRQVVKRSTTCVVCLCVVPWLLGYGVFAAGAVARSYRVLEAPGTCILMPYDDSDEAGARFGSFLLMDSIVHVWLPMCWGLVCYVSVYAKKMFNTWQKQHRHSDQHDPKIDPRMMTLTPVVVGTTMVAWSQTANNLTATTAFQQRQEKSNDKLRFLAAAYLVEFVLVFPVSFVWAANYYIYLSEHVPVVAVILNSMSFLSFAVVPLVYMMISADFRQAYRTLISKLLCASASSQS